MNMKLDEKTLSIRIDGELMRKFRHVAKKEKRSINRELLWLICQNIEEFEAEHGPIPVGEEDA
jgi:predicted transcriptional regulator